MDVLLCRNTVDLRQPLVHPDKAQISGQHGEPDWCCVVKRFQLGQLFASELLAFPERSLIVLLFCHIADDGDPVTGLVGVVPVAGHVPLRYELGSGAAMIDHFPPEAFVRLELPAKLFGQ